jgi:hypothetical protein
MVNYAAVVPQIGKCSMTYQIPETTMTMIEQLGERQRKAEQVRKHLDTVYSMPAALEENYWLAMEAQKQYKATGRRMSAATVEPKPITRASAEKRADEVFTGMKDGDRSTDLYRMDDGHWLAGDHAGDQVHAVIEDEAKRVLALNGMHLDGSPLAAATTPAPAPAVPSWEAAIAHCKADGMDDYSARKMAAETWPESYAAWRESRRSRSPITK